MRQRAFAVAATLSAALAGCMMGPDYTKPAIDTPKAYRYEPKQTAETANTEWWKQFGDPVLDDLIAEALANNYSVKIAAANVEQAAAVLTQTRAPLYPQVGYQGDAARLRLPQSTESPLVPGTTNPQNSYSVLAGATWEIDLWGRIRRLTQAAQANLLATEQARRGVILSLVGAVGNSYLLLRGLDEQLEISKHALETYAASLKLFELRFKYGQISQMNVEQVRVQYETAAAQIPQIEQQIAQLENAMSILLGRNPGSIPRGKTILALTLPEVPAGLPSQLLERRPDVLQSEQQLIAANAQIGAAKALYFPTISLTGALGSSSNQLSDLFTGPAQVWRFGGSLAGPIFTGGAISGQVAQATAAQKAALLSYRLAIQSAFADVDNALVARQKLGEQITAQENLVQALRTYSRLAYLQFDGGYAPYTDVLQAEQQLLPAELTLAAVRTQQFSSLVRIYQATGGGWIDIAQKVADAPAMPAQNVAAQDKPPETPATAETADRIEVVMDGDTSVVNVYRVRGSGGAEVIAPKSGWPPRLVVRLHGFASLESLTAKSTGGELACTAAKNAKGDAEPVCRIGGTITQGVSKGPGYLEMVLPAGLLKAGSGPVEVRWADRS